MSFIISCKSNPKPWKCEFNNFQGERWKPGWKEKVEWIPSRQSGQSGSLLALVHTSAERPSSVHSCRVQCGKSSAVGCGRSFPAVSLDFKFALHFSRWDEHCVLPRAPVRRRRALSDSRYFSRALLAALAVVSSLWSARAGSGNAAAGAGELGHRRWPQEVFSALGLILARGGCSSQAARGNPGVHGRYLLYLCGFLIGI